MIRHVRITLAVAATLLALPAAHAAGKAAKADATDDLVDISKWKDKLSVFTDGKGHYLAAIPYTISDEDDAEHGYLFYSSDGKAFYAQRRTGGSRNGDDAFDTVFWEPRVAERYMASFGMKEKKFYVTCDKRTTELTEVPKDKAQAMIDAGKFHGTRWKRQAYALARDTNGVYYFVDKMREPAGNKDFRVFRGQKGAVKEQKMINIVSDSEGDIFVTKAGKLKLVLDKHETSWSEATGSTKLTPLELENNVVLIYTNLGPYIGEALGTPCDDL